jgi:hypothetical protein
MALLSGSIANASALQNRGLEVDYSAFGPVLFEMCVNRGVDACLPYVSDVLRLIHGQHPDTLKSSEKLDIEFVLQFSSMDELLTALLERRAHSLSYRRLAGVYKISAVG